MNELALSITEQFRKDHKLLASPVSSLARKSGLSPDQVYNKLIKKMSEIDLGENIKFAEVAIRYATVIDKNRLREEVGEAFFLALDQAISIVKDGLDSRENWIVRKAMSLHGNLIDEASEKQRFVETILGERKFELLKESQENLTRLQKEIIDFELNDGGSYQQIGCAQ